MSSLRRWQVWGDNDGTRAEDPDGEWVLYADVERMLTWRPIATYPAAYDPNPVLLFWPYWTQVPVIGERAEDGVWWTEKWLGEDVEDPGPTHWMPLPDGPTA